MVARPHVRGPMPSFVPGSGYPGSPCRVVAFTETRRPTLDSYQEAVAVGEDPRTGQLRTWRLAFIDDGWPDGSSPAHWIVR